VTFLDFYHLREQPFGVTPDPAYLYPSQTHCEALAALSSGLEADRGFMALIAEPGMGKTTLLYQLLDQWRESARIVFLFQTQCDSRELFRYVLGELGIDAEQMGLAAMHHKLNQILFKEMLAGKRFILVVDEAQNLDESVLETVRLLSNFETPHAKLLQIVLAGQTQLTEKLALPRLAQLRQRISVMSHLAPLTVTDTIGYVEHRLKVAGYRGEPLFTADALQLIARRSRGIPRNINNNCYNSLSLAHASGCTQVSYEIAHQAVKQIENESTAPQLPVVAAREANPVAISEPRPAIPSPGRPASELTYAPSGRFSFARWAFGAAFVSILCFGSWYWFRFYPRSAESRQDLQGSSAPLSSSYPSEVALRNGSSAREDIGSGQILTVVAKPEQTLKEISLLYAGHFDPQMLEDIRMLNPELKDADHIAAGQLIRLPLPPGTLREEYDTSDATSAVRDGPSESTFAKVRAFLGGKKW
jgi:type II secretory pathway predicted ATPase ExeA